MQLEWLEVTSPQNEHLVRNLTVLFGKGEAEAIALATEIGDCDVLLDDGKARKAAEYHGLKVVGTVGILLRAKQQGYLPQIKSLLDRLIAQGFRISGEIYRKVLQLAQE